MKKLSLVLVTIFISVYVVNGQQQQQQRQQAVKQPTTEQKKAIKEALLNYNQLKQAAESAKDKLTIQLLSTLNSLGLKAEETQLSWDEEGFPIFTRIDPVTASQQPQLQQLQQEQQKEKKNENKNP